ncbi:hypothetical protein [Halorubrum lipolyticum]|uniref:Uncharacterized protein n=1 Tax=Halorubrum lipolyticum DSM 21995 TaxID=1227482 RepID=M0P1K6_9EURY|nr:hypothetical protein [Halorubrum lipolyticum]EMA63738.1 hypothetical protein C469_02746 [Halorubrum lipolyticum DSM 21995]
MNTDTEREIVSVTVSPGTALALETRADESDRELSTVVADLVSDHLKTSVDGDVRTDVTVENGTEVPVSLSKRQQTMAAAVGGDHGVEGFVASALETRTESATESVTVELPGSIIATLDALVFAGEYADRPTALRRALLDEGSDSLSDPLDTARGANDE